MNGVHCIFYFVTTELLQLLNLSEFTVLTIFIALFLVYFLSKFVYESDVAVKTKTKKKLI